ncbi:GNAT family N-acetyltransferase [Mesobacterium sp. TK19101]|uniref:GNAT family N-acetyltransferase n=1 Tax=Mesobacterium hydrothermale TaxID=3111907 RepID=A0ABU6HEQ5_9RHOB|nr:GNAT family N-acetyltransferase [Mesobacterium sp. TK19101]MEC3860771.1 GNAT family N-acetyltransferase [Mesobacterium sp. TK19101]
MTVTIPVIETDRLVLRAPALADHAPLCAYFQDPRSHWNGGPLDAVAVGRALMATVGQWHLRGFGLWFLETRDTQAFAGFAGIFMPFDWPEPELGYAVTAAHEGTGLAAEAVTAARQAAATHFGLTRLASYISPENTRSQAFARRLGASLETVTTLRGAQTQIWRHPEVAP